MTTYFIYSLTLAVEFLTIISLVTTILWPDLFVSILSNKLKAFSPILSIFCFTVVSEGFTYLATSKSSNPVTEISSGTLIPFSSKPLINPIAIKSEEQITAVTSEPAKNSPAS